MVKCKVLLNEIDKIADFVKVASKIEEDVALEKGRYIIDGKSIMALFTLSLDEEVTLVIHTDDNKMLDKFKEWMVK